MQRLQRHRGASHLRLRTQQQVARVADQAHASARTSGHQVVDAQTVGFLQPDAALCALGIQGARAGLHRRGCTANSGAQPQAQRIGRDQRPGFSLQAALQRLQRDALAAHKRVLAQQQVATRRQHHIRRLQVAHQAVDAQAIGLRQADVTACTLQVQGTAADLHRRQRRAHARAHPHPQHIGADQRTGLGLQAALQRLQRHRGASHLRLRTQQQVARVADQAHASARTSGHQVVDAQTVGFLQPDAALCALGIQGARAGLHRRGCTADPGAQPQAQRIGRDQRPGFGLQAALQRLQRHRVGPHQGVFAEGQVAVGHVQHQVCRRGIGHGMPQFGGPLDLQGDVAAAVFHIQRTRPDADGRVRPVDCRARPQRQQVGVHAHRACARRRQHQAVGGLQGQRRQVEHGLGLALRCRDGDLGADDPQAVHAAARRRAADQMVDAGQGEAVGVADAQAGVDQHRHRLTSEVQRAGTGCGAALQRRAVAEGDLRRTVDDQPPAIHQHHAALEEHRAAGVDDQVAIDIDLVAEGHVHRVPHVQAFQRSQFVHAQREALRRGAGAAQVGPCRTEQIAGAVATTQRLQRDRTHPAATDHQHGGHARPTATRQGHIRVRAVGVSLAARGQGEAAHAVADGALQRHRAAVRGQVEHIAAPHPAIDAAGDGEVAVAVLRRVASHQADAASKAHRIVDQQIATHRDGGAIGQAGRLARANDRQRLAGESAADRDLATLARRVDHQRHGQRHAVLAAADRDRVGPTTGPQHQRRDGRVRIRQPIGIQHQTAGATAQGDGRRRIGGHHLQALAGAIRLGQVGQLGRAGAERHRAQHHGCSGIQAAFFGGGELAAQRDCVAHIQLDAACRQVGGDHQLVGLDRQAGVAQVDHTAGFHRLQLDPVADEVQRAQRLVPVDLLNPADRLARAQPDHVVGQALADRRQRQRQRVVGQFPRAAAGARARVGRR